MLIRPIGSRMAISPLARLSFRPTFRAISLEPFSLLYTAVVTFVGFIILYFNFRFDLFVIIKLCLEIPELIAHSTNGQMLSLEVSLCVPASAPVSVNVARIVHRSDTLSFPMQRITIHEEDGAVDLQLPYTRNITTDSSVT